LALTSPRFDAKPVARIRAQLIAGLKSDAEDPHSIAGRLWYRTVFPDHPYGRPTSGVIDSIKAVTADDLRNFVSRHFSRDKLVIGVVGDISADELAVRLDEMFGGLRAKSTSSEVSDATPAAAGRTIVVNRDIPQSVVIFGQQGVKRDHPDYYTAYVMNRVLGGGGFSSRLNIEVREKRGLAYSVYSYLNPLDHVGLIMGGVATANARVAKSLSLIRGEWKRMAEAGVGEKELAAVKTYINGSFPLRLDSNRRISRLLVGIQLSRLGIDYLGRRPSLIDAVTADDIRRVAGRLLKADKLTVVVVGRPEGLASQP
jgi:zinc protease